MIALSDLSAAIAAHIDAATGRSAFASKLHTAHYPSYHVRTVSKQTSLIAGGRQVLREVEVSITCIDTPHRDVTEQQHMLDALYPILLPYFSACGRHFSPIELTLRQEGAQNALCFSLSFCDLPPTRDTEPLEAMQTLSLQLSPSAANS